MKTTAFALLGALALASQTAPTTKPISINLREGTNMAAALSPDGRALMIDLQGSLWTLPASGGPAKRVTDTFCVLIAVCDISTAPRRRTPAVFMPTSCSWRLAPDSTF